MGWYSALMINDPTLRNNVTGIANIIHLCQDASVDHKENVPFYKGTLMVAALMVELLWIE